MTSLTSAPIAPLLDQLFQTAEASWSTPSSTLTYWADLSPEEQSRLLRSTDEYRDLYARLKDFPLPVSRETGQLLYMVACATRAKTIVEFGTSFGVSTIHLAAALRDGGGGRLITTEFEPSKVRRARENLEAAELLDLVEIREGDALQTLASDLPEAIDLVLLDGAKGLYPAVLDLLEGRLRAGSILFADNADDSPQYLDRVRSPSAGYLSVPFSSDVEVSMRLG